MDTLPPTHLLRDASHVWRPRLVRVSPHWPGHCAWLLHPQLLSLERRLPLGHSLLLLQPPLVPHSCTQLLLRLRLLDLLLLLLGRKCRGGHGASHCIPRLLQRCHLLLLLLGSGGGSRRRVRVHELRHAQLLHLAWILLPHWHACCLAVLNNPWPRRLCGGRCQHSEAARAGAGRG